MLQLVLGEIAPLLTWVLSYFQLFLRSSLPLLKLVIKLLDLGRAGGFTTSSFAKGLPFSKLRVAHSPLVDFVSSAAQPTPWFFLFAGLVAGF